MSYLTLLFLFSNLFIVHSTASDISATIGDKSGIFTNVKGIYLYWQSGNWYTTYDSFKIIRGDSSVNIEFSKIKLMGFNWSLNPPMVNITSNDGEIIRGEPENVENYWFKGDTSFGEFSIPVNNVMAIIFNS